MHSTKIKIIKDNKIRQCKHTLRMDCYRLIQADTNGSKQCKPLDLALKWDQNRSNLDGSKRASSLDLIFRWTNQTRSLDLILISLAVISSENGWPSACVDAHNYIDRLTFWLCEQI
jgi:hypothetical protein